MIAPKKARESVHSPPIRVPFSATERFINKTTNVTASITTANSQKQSKYASADACWWRRFFQRLPRQLRRSSRISGLLKEPRLRLLEEKPYGRIKRIEGLAQPQRMELIPHFVQRLGQRRANAASFVAKKAQQARGRPTQQGRSVETGCDVHGRKKRSIAGPRPDDLV
jgi:hypothetical protein